MSHQLPGCAQIPGVGFCWAMNWLSNFGVTLSFPVLVKADGSPIKNGCVDFLLMGFTSTFPFCLGGLCRGYDCMQHLLSSFGICPAAKTMYSTQSGNWTPWDREWLRFILGTCDCGSFFSIYIWQTQIGILGKTTMQHWTNLWQVPPLNMFRMDHVEIVGFQFQSP